MHRRYFKSGQSVPAPCLGGSEGVSVPRWVGAQACSAVGSVPRDTTSTVWTGGPGSGRSLGSGLWRFHGALRPHHAWAPGSKLRPGELRGPASAEPQRPRAGGQPCPRAAAPPPGPGEPGTRAHSPVPSCPAAPAVSGGPEHVPLREGGPGEVQGGREGCQATAGGAASGGGSSVVS